MAPAVIQSDCPDFKDLDPEEQARASTYAWLAALLRRPPDEPMLARIRALSTDDAAPAAGLSGAWSYLRLASEHAVASDVDDEFHQLFIGLGRGELVPFGSWYLTGFLMERPLGRLRDDLSALGFERQEGVREPEDHIAALFEVMALLIRDPRVTLGSEQKFFSDHIEPWAGRFFADLEAAGEARYYRAVGRLGSAFFGVEKESLAMLV